MKILLLGANGRTGRQLLQRALDAGDSVTALVRSEDRLADVVHERLRIVACDVTDAGALAPLIPGHDVVVSALGPRRPTRKAAAIYQESAAALVEAMSGSRTRRLLVTSSALLFPDQSVFGRVLRVLVSPLVRAATRMEALIGASDLHWTIARTGFLTDGEEATYTTSDRVGGTISRNGLACFLHDEINRRDHECEVVGLAA